MGTHKPLSCTTHINHDKQTDFPSNTGTFGNLTCSVLHVDLVSLSGAKTLPYLVMFAMSIAGGWAGDWLIQRKKIPVARGRKVINTVGKWLARC
jgi:uncharacterized membrane protein YfcA